MTAATILANGGPTDRELHVGGHVIVVNLTGQPQQVTGVDMAADWAVAGSANGHAEAITPADGGLYPGELLGAMTPTYFRDFAARMTIPLLRDLLTA